MSEVKTTEFEFCALELMNVVDRSIEIVIPELDELEDETYYVVGAKQRLKLGCELNWSNKREIVYERDNGICHICGKHVPWEDYNCGHIVDRCCGGSDRLSNLVCMCAYCNDVMKDCHETREQYVEWLGAMVSMAKSINLEVLFFREVMARAERARILRDPTATG